MALTSNSDSVQHITVNCLPEHGKANSKTVTLGSRQTLIAGCGTDVMEATNSILVDDQNSESMGAVGIDLISDGMPGSFSAFGLARHQAEGESFFTSISFSDPMMLHSSGTVYTGMPVGAAPLLSSQLYTPRLSLTNFSAKVAHVSVTFARTSDGGVDAQNPRSFVVAARSSTTVVLKDLSGDPGLRNSFVVSSDAAPGEVLSKLVSTSKGRPYDVESLGKDRDQFEDGGEHPWSIETGGDSTVLLFNPEKTQQDFTVAISAQDILWEKAYHLHPQETISLSIRGLIQGQVKGARNVVLPKDAQSGTVGWISLQHTGQGRLLQSNLSLGMARSFSCSYYSWICGAIGAHSDTVTVGDGSYQGDLLPRVCVSIAKPVSCASGGTNNFIDYDNIYTYVWSANPPNNTSIDCNNCMDATYNVSTPGTVTMTGTVSGTPPGGVSGSPYCPGSTQATLTVKPSISGPQDVWWFGGQNPSGYSTSIILTASGSNATVWGVTAGASEVNINPTGNTVTVTSSGASFSNAIGDVSIVATDNGQTSAPFYLTTHKPYLLSPANTSDGCDPTYGYLDQLQYTVEDQMLIPLPTSVYYNEQWTTQVVPVISNNWQRPSETPGETNGSTLTDLISGPGDPNASPKPVCVGDSTEVQYWGQDWHIGSTLTGVGPRVQSDDLTRFVQHAEHQNTASPNP